MSVNKVILVGNLGHDPESTVVGEDRHRCTFSLASNRRYKDKAGELVEETTWHRVVTWGKLAETCGQYLAQGRLVYVEGRIRNYQVTPEGATEPQWRSEIVGEVVRFLGKKNGNGNGHGEPAEGDPEF